jgi:outer membrane protein, heavy metal efflux system
MWAMTGLRLRSTGLVMGLCLAGATALPLWAADTTVPENTAPDTTAPVLETPATDPAEAPGSSTQVMPESKTAITPERLISPPVPEGTNPPEMVLTLEEAVQKALTANLNIRAKEFEAKSVKANEITANLIPNPTASFGVFNGGSPSTSEWSFSITQQLELGGKRGKRLNSAEQATAVENYSVEDLKRLTTLQVQQSYTGMIVAKAQAEQTKIDLKELDDELKLQALRRKTGDLSDLDYLRIEQIRFLFESDAADAEQNLKIAMVNFRVAVGVDVVPENFDVRGTFNLKDIEYSRQDLYKMAEGNRPDVKQAAQDVKRAQADNELAHANAVVDVFPSIGYGWTDNNGWDIFTKNLSSANGNNNGNILGLSMAIPIFSRNQGEIERTAKDAQRTGVVKDAAVVGAHSDVDVALAGLRDAKLKFAALRDNYFPKAKMIRDRTELAYRQGAASLLDFLDAERDYRSMAFAFINSEGNYDAALYQLEAALGVQLK